MTPPGWWALRHASASPVIRTRDGRRCHGVAGCHRMAVTTLADTDAVPPWRPCQVVGRHTSRVSPPRRRWRLPDRDLHCQRSTDPRQTGMCSPQLTNPVLRVEIDGLLGQRAPAGSLRDAESDLHSYRRKQLLIVCPSPPKVRVSVLSSVLPSGLTSVFSWTPEPTPTFASPCRPMRLSPEFASAPTDPLSLRVSPGLRHG